MIVDWTTAAAVIVAFAAIMGLIIQWFKKDPHRKSIEDHNLRLTKVETKVGYLGEKINDLSIKIVDHDNRDQKDFQRVENKIEKLTDLMIELIQQDQTKDTSIIKRRK